MEQIQEGCVNNDCVQSNYRTKAVVLVLFVYISFSLPPSTYPFISLDLAWDWAFWSSLISSIIHTGYDDSLPWPYLGSIPYCNTNYKCLPVILVQQLSILTLLSHLSHIIMLWWAKKTMNKEHFDCVTSHASIYSHSLFVRSFLFLFT